MATPPNNGNQGFPITISEQDLQTPGVPRLNRSLTYIWTFINSGQGSTSAASSSASVQSQYSTIDPRRYGALANGTADDSIPISKAIAAGGLYLQAGIVYGYTWAGISAAISAVGNGFTITGGGTIRLLSGGTAALTLSGSTLIRLLGFNIDGNSKTGSHPVIYLNGTSQVWLNSVFVFGASTGLGSTNDTYDARGCSGILDNIGYI